MARDVIATAAFQPADPGHHLAQPYFGLAFPAHWREVVLDLYRRNRPSTRTDVPIKRLNEVLAALAPDLVSVATRATADDTLPWVYATNQYDPATMKTFVLAWLRDLRPAIGDYPLVREAIDRLAPDNLEWTLYSVDLLAHTLSPGGTAIPDPRLYKLLPDVIAERIENLPPFEHNGDKVHFRRAATHQGAELISWPPRRHPMSAGKTKPWRYSTVINITLQTVPFDPIPRLHLDVSIRRWVRGRLDIPTGRGVSAYLLVNSPWITDTAQSPRFAHAMIKWGRKEHHEIWRAPQPSLLKQLSMAADFPEAAILAKAADELIPQPHQLDVDGVQAALTFHTVMSGKHGVRPGVMPDERRRIIEWASTALEPDFVRLPDLRRIPLGRQEHVIRKHESVPATADTEEKIQKRDDAHAANVGIDTANAVHRRQLVFDVTGERLSAHILYQTTAGRDELLRAAQDHLGLPAPATSEADDQWRWTTDELTVEIAASRFDLAGPLGGDAPPRSADAVKTATTARRDQVSQLCEGLTADCALVFVEIDKKNVFVPRTSDPKFAIRLGCADAGLVSQFITIDRPDEDDRDDEPESVLAHRADAAWADGMRQLGARFIPQHSLGTAVPTALNQVAFWLIKRRADSTKLGPQFTPIAVMARPGQNTLLGRTPDSDGWIPYRQLLLDLVGRARPDDLKTEDQQKAEAARFLHKVLYGLRNEDTLLMIDAHNSRFRVPWLLDSAMVTDMLQIGNGPVQRLALYGRNLRLVRVRGADRHETAEWWTPADTGFSGFSKGLWQHPDAGPQGRVFYSTMERSSKHQVKLDAVKITSTTRTVTRTDPATGDKKQDTRQVCDATVSPWNPTLLELTVMGLPADEQPQTWAAFIHQQQQPDEYREGLARPLLLHLARKAGDYALPHQEDEPSPQAGTTDDGDEEETAEDLT